MDKLEGKVHTNDYNFIKSLIEPDNTEIYITSDYKLLQSLFL